MSASIQTQLLAAYADEHRDHLSALRATLADFEHADFEDSYRHAHSLKGAARAVDLPVVVDIAHVLESLLEAWWEGRATVDDDVRRRVGRALDAIEDMSALALEGQPVPATHAALEQLSEALHRLGVDLPVPAMEIHVVRPHCTPLPVVPPVVTLRVEAVAARRLAATTAALLIELERQREAEQALWRLGAELAVLGLKQGDALHEALAALQSTHGEVMREMAERDWALSRTAAALKEDVNRLRTVAAEGPLGGFGPMVRELAAEEGKEVRFDAEGLNALADRDVLSALAEAVLHLLRNAIHHGIEGRAERMAAGKDPVGHLSLSVAASGPRLEVRVTDDGRGLDARVVGREAAARGLMDPAQVEHADPDRLRQLIFEPGFTTAHAVTTTAGRGMGMSIVRKVVNRLQGNVELNSQPGQGTEVMMSVPVTLLAQRLVLVEVRGQVFGLPAAALVRLAMVPTDTMVRVEGQVLAVIDEFEVPLVDLGNLLSLPGSMELGTEASVAVMRHGRTRLGLVADRFRDVRDLPVAALDLPLTNDSRLAGTVVLKDGGLALVLSPVGLAMYATIPAVAAFVAKPVVRKVPAVLVVDDSITTRTLERSILETHGYRVILAVDGRDAMEKLIGAGVVRPDIVVSDLEMPRLDGFGLLSAIRSDARLRSLPVILVSSRDTPADRERGLTLGADAYIVKTRFDQDDLLRTIERLL
ncbi:MAG: response regulator [Rhodospirillaceae bacterium]|nr:response regulator [Rhodospirillales bacterium]